MDGLTYSLLYIYIPPDRSAFKQQFMLLMGDGELVYGRVRRAGEIVNIKKTSQCRVCLAGKSLHAMPIAI